MDGERNRLGHGHIANKKTYMISKHDDEGDEAARSRPRSVSMTASPCPVWQQLIMQVRPIPQKRKTWRVTIEAMMKASADETLTSVSHWTFP